MTNRNKQAGTRWESTLVKYFRGRGFEADRIGLHSAEDEGDLVLRDGGFPVIVEAKREKAFRPAEWIKQAEVEAQNYATHREILLPHHIVVAARRNHAPEKAYVITTLGEWVRQRSH